MRKRLAVLVVLAALVATGLAATRHRALRLHFRLAVFRNAAPDTRAASGQAVIALGPEGEQALEALAFSDEEAVANDPATPLRQAALDALARRDLLDVVYECLVPAPPARLPSYVARARGLALPPMLWFQVRSGVLRRDGWRELVLALVRAIDADPGSEHARRCREALAEASPELRRLAERPREEAPPAGP